MQISRPRRTPLSSNCNIKLFDPLSGVTAGWGTMNKLLLCLLMAGLAATASAQMTINGAGATFPYPIYSKWFDAYAKIDPSVRFNYQSIGSGGGQKQILAQTVDF